MRAFGKAVRLVIALTIAVLLLPFLVIVALRGPELFLSKDEQDNFRLRFRQAKAWVLDKHVDTEQ